MPKSGVPATAAQARFHADRAHGDGRGRLRFSRRSRATRIPPGPANAPHRRAQRDHGYGGREEKLFSTTNAYSNLPANLGYVGAAFPLNVGSDYYQINVVVPDPAQADLTPTTYIITATPIGAQASDTQCASLSVNQLGVQTFTGTGTQHTCWGN